MAALFSTAIVAFCTATASGQYDNACQKAVDAGTRQVGIRQQVDQTEDQTIRYVNSQATYYTPKPVQEVVGASFFLYRTAKDKKVQFKLPTLGMCDSITNDVALESYTVTFKWSF